MCATAGQLVGSSTWVLATRGHEHSWIVQLAVRAAPIEAPGTRRVVEVDVRRVRVNTGRLARFGLRCAIGVSPGCLATLAYGADGLLGLLLVRGRVLLVGSRGCRLCRGRSDASEAERANGGQDSDYCMLFNRACMRPRARCAASTSHTSLAEKVFDLRGSLWSVGVEVDRLDQLTESLILLAHSDRGEATARPLCHP